MSPHIDVTYPDMQPWRPVTHTTELSVPTGEVSWRGRLYDLANVLDLQELADVLHEEETEEDLADAMTQTAAALNAEADAVEAENRRLEQQIARDDARTAKLKAELHDKGISTAAPGEVETVVARWKRENDQPRPSGVPLSAQEAARAHRLKYGM